jgi:hypothetical protein
MIFSTIVSQRKRNNQDAKYRKLARSIGPLAAQSRELPLPYSAPARTMVSWPSDSYLCSMAHSKKNMSTRKNTTRKEEKHYKVHLAYGGSIEDRELLRSRNMNGLGSNFSVQKLVHDSNVCKCSSCHHFIITTTAAIRIEVLTIHTTFK